MAGIALGALEVLGIHDPHVGLAEHGSVLVAGDGHEVPQAGVLLPLAAGHIDRQISIAALIGHIDLLHACLAWDQHVPARMHHHPLHHSLALRLINTRVLARSRAPDFAQLACLAIERCCMNQKWIGESGQDGLASPAQHARHLHACHPGDRDCTCGISPAMPPL